MTIQRSVRNLYPFLKSEMTNWGAARNDLLGTYVESSSGTRLSTTTITDSRQLMTQVFDGTAGKGPQFEAGQWYFAGVNVTSFSGTSFFRNNFRLTVVPESGVATGFITGVGLNGIIFKYDATTSSDFIFGVSVSNGTGETSGTVCEYGDPIVAKIDDEFSPPELVPISLVGGFDFANANTISGSFDGIVTFIKGAQLNPPIKRAIMINADSYAVLRDVNSYAQLYQQANLTTQTFPNGIAGRDLATFNTNYATIIDLSACSHQVSAKTFTPVYQSDVISAQIAFLQLGLNDVDGGASQATIEVAFETAFDNYAFSNVKVVVCTIPPNDNFSGAKNTVKNAVNAFLVARAAADSDIFLYDLNATLNDGGDVDTINTAFDDGSGFHPNDDGNLAILAGMTPIINQAFASLAGGGGISLTRPLTRNLTG